jgi:hypothetical protein
MQMRQRLVAAGAALGLLSFAVTIVPASAITNGHTQRVRVNRCSPTRNVTTTAVGPYGYGPGFYPRGAYYWDDPFGYPYYQPPVAVNQSASLSIDYVNVTPVTMQTIEFGLVANGRLVAEVRDVGKFSPNIEIKHTFGLSPNVFPLSTALPQCIPLRITYEDQATWVNPELHRLQRAILASP